jgi:hypothetical protein
MWFTYLLYDSIVATRVPAGRIAGSSRDFCRCAEDASRRFRIRGKSYSEALVRITVARVTPMRDSSLPAASRGHEAGWR